MSEADQQERNQNQISPRWKIPFFTIWSGQALSFFGSAIGRFALIWWLTDLTGSAVVLATATLVAILPQIFIGPFAGAYVDRWNRRIVMIVADSLIALVSLALAYLFWSNQMQIWHVYVVVFLRAIGSAFHGPAMSTSTSLMVPEKQLSRVAGLNQTLRGSLMMAGPLLGALALEIMPLHYVMLLDLATALPAILPLFFIMIPQPERSKKIGETSIWTDVKEGIDYIRAWQGLFLLLIMAAIGNFVYNPIISLLPLYVKEYFGGGAVQLGWLQSSQGIGIVFGGLILGAWGGFKSRVLTSLLGQLLQGAATLIFGLLVPEAFGIALVVWGVAFFFNVFYNGPMFALLQANVKPEMQGRVFTALNSMVLIAYPLSLLIAGPLTEKFGIQIWIVTGGIVAVSLGTIALMTPSIRNLEKDPKANHVPQE